MTWTSFDTAHPTLVDELIVSPRNAIPCFQARLPDASMGERLRLFGLLAIAHWRIGDEEQALGFIREGDRISPRLVQWTAAGDFTVYAAEILAHNGQQWPALQRLNAAITGITPHLRDVSTPAARCKVRRRQVIAANLYITRAYVHYYCFERGRQSAQDIATALDILPSTCRLKNDTVNMIRRSCLAALSLLAIVLASGAKAPAGLRDRLDVAEDVFEDVIGIQAAQLARCRAVLIAPHDLDSAEALLLEALHWCLEAQADNEFKQTLEMLSRVAGRSAERLARQWSEQWATRWG